MKEIPLTKGYVALVDDEDYEWLVSNFKWFVSETKWGPKARARIRGTNSKILMHRLITNAPDNMQVDHKNHNGLDNTRKNLRVCSQSENQWNQKPKSGGKGAHWYKKIKKWGAGIRFNGKRHHLGVFNTKKEALMAYDAAAKSNFGEFVCLNFPRVSDEVTSE